MRLDLTPNLLDGEYDATAKPSAWGRGWRVVRTNCTHADSDVP